MFLPRKRKIKRVREVLLKLTKAAGKNYSPADFLCSAEESSSDRRGCLAPLPSLFLFIPRRAKNSGYSRQNIFFNVNSSFGYLSSQRARAID